MASSLVASCGGNNASMDETAPAQDYVSADAMPQHIEAAKPLLPPDKDVTDFSDLFDDILPDILDPGFDLDLWWESLHVPVVEGDNAIALDQYLAKSANVTQSDMLLDVEEGPLGIPIPVIGPGLDLVSQENEMAYVEFGLSGIPDGMDVVKVSFDGQGFMGPGANHGVYVGLSNYAKDAYSWFGAYDIFAGNWEVDLNIEDASSTGHAYLVIAVHGGDELILKHLNVTVGNRIIIEIPDFEIEIPEFSL